MIERLNIGMRVIRRRRKVGNFVKIFWLVSGGLVALCQLPISQLVKDIRGIMVKILKSLKHWGDARRFEFRKENCSACWARRFDRRFRKFGFRQENR